MLILTRRRGEKVMIDNGNIEVTMLGTKRGSVRLGFSATKGVDIDREEIFIKKQIEGDKKQKLT